MFGDLVLNVFFSIALFDCGVQIVFTIGCLNIFKYPLSRETTKNSLYKSVDH